jgi:hypothetical protein
MPAETGFPRFSIHAGLVKHLMPEFDFLRNHRRQESAFHLPRLPASLAEKDHQDNNFLPAFTHSGDFISPEGEMCPHM